MNGFALPTGVKNGISATPDFIMGLAFLVTWIEPTAIGGNMHTYFLLIMLLEFITIHSAGFMAWAIFADASKFKRFARVIGLGMFYSLFIAAFSLMYGEWWPLGAFWLLVANRIMSALLGDGNDATRQIGLLASWAWSVFCYVLSIMITVVLPMPEFGWTKEYVSRLTFSGGGLWFENPQSLLAAGFLYFTSVAIFELYGHKLTTKFAVSNPDFSFIKKKLGKRFGHPNVRQTSPPRIWEAGNSNYRFSHSHNGAQYENSTFHCIIVHEHTRSFRSIGKRLGRYQDGRIELC